MTQTTAPKHDLTKNLRWGVFWGLCGAGVYCGFATLLFVFRGAAPFLANRTTFGTTIGAYVIGGLSTGIILGVFRPLTGRAWGVALIGFLCAVAVWLSALGTVEGFQHIDGADLRMIVLLSLITGPLCALLARRRLSGIGSFDT